MRKTLLLVFVHGFKGGDDTFGSFPEHLRALISHALPKIDVVAITYPKFETRGELKDCVERFRDWLQNKVIDLEVAHGTPSPTVDPSVHTVVIGHSMGGIVAAEIVLLLASEQPVHPAASQDPKATSWSHTSPTSGTSPSRPSPGKPPSGSSVFEPDEARDAALMFPRIIGVVAFDTPFLGISPGVIAHGAEGHYRTASTAYSAFSEIGSALGWGANAAKSGGSLSSSRAGIPSGAAQAPSAGMLTNGEDAAAAPRWQSWGKYAMFAGAAGAVAAGGAAALYSQRERLSSGWGWVGSHLEFVGVLLRGDECKSRIERLGNLTRGGGAGGRESAMPAGHSQGGADGFGGSVVFYTVLGRGADKEHIGSNLLTDEKRTFCKLPSALTSSTAAQQQKSIKPGPSGAEAERRLRWIPAVNDKVADEVAAHISMFFPRDNPGFYSLGERAKGVIVSWVDQGWYESSSSTPSHQSPPSSTTAATSPGRGAAASSGASDGGKTYGEVGDDGWERPDYDDERVKAKQREKEDYGPSLGDLPPPGVSEAEAVWVHSHEANDNDDDGDVRMRDESVEPSGGDGRDRSEDLESSVVVDKAS